MKFGLKEEHLIIIIDFIKTIPEIEEVLIFGSRAMGNYKKGSDIDLAIKGKEITRDLLLKISFYLNEETYLPYFFDIVDYNKIDNLDLKNHIDTHGIVLYKK
ncbi:nucleotidyltransferase family protein [Marinitoga litoralis]|jgi:predicted nucleotidyltransferase|uniref:nucleotidyltransferase family protein n=1 Tax=Marinitoga litoralis TaxID=570855 RepID=UPI0019613190|nr:nucleotidyltransferase domain-containing protein [Marinitoga litoralis]MBM7559021.1 putative nucleotidyltransferase [Marinitoga litoralis]